MSAHTPGPWSVFDCNGIISICIGTAPNGGRPCVVNWNGFDSCGLPINKQIANAYRIVDCVNACDGLNTEFLENIAITGGLIERFALLNQTELQRDELLDALKELCTRIDIDGASPLDSSEYDHALEIIAKAEGKQ